MAPTFTLSKQRYDDESVNRIDVIDVTCEEYAQEVLGFSNSSKSGNLTPSLDPIITTSSPSLTHFEGGNFVLKEIKACLTSDSIPPGIDDDDFDPEGDILLLEKLLNDDPSSPLPPKELNFEKLKLIKSNVSTNFEDDYYDSEGDIIYLESLLIKDTIPNLLPEVFLDIDPKSLNDEPDFDNLKSMVRVFDLGIHEKIISPTYVRLPFEDRHYFFLTFVIKIFLPFLTYLVNSLPLLSSGSEDTIFDPGISAYSFYSLEPVAYEIMMMIFPFFCFCPKDNGIREESS
ncbi:hypothetical protein Tco_0815381 [Tanacetum coccineum]